MRIKVFSFGVSDGTGELRPEYEEQINTFLAAKGCSFEGTRVTTATCTGVNRMGDVFVNVTITLVY